MLENCKHNYMVHYDNWNSNRKETKQSTNFRPGIGLPLG